MSNHVCEICHPRSFQHVHGAMKRKAFITVAMVRSPDPSCWYSRSHVGRSLPPYLALPPSVPPPPRSLQPAALAFPLQSEDFAFPVPSRTSAFPPATPSAYSAAFTIQVQLAATRSLLKGHISETSSYPFGHSSPCPTPRVSARANRTPVLPTPRSGHPWWVNTDPCGALTPRGRLMVLFCSSKSQLSSVGKDLAKSPTPCHFLCPCFDSFFLTRQSPK